MVRRAAVLSLFCSLALTWQLPGQETTQTEERTVGESPAAAETLTRGPLHESFAEVVTYNPEPGLTVDKQPPAPIDEVPPDVKPEGEDYVWIPGYWAWDDELNDFIWVSGAWRIPPPQLEWIPGYWRKVDKGFQWISGYWSKPREQVSYLPPPPQSQERGPSSPQPFSDTIWVPGNWTWQNARYAWRAGYWAHPKDDWTWVPAHYVWTPNGCIFVDGYWDYLLPQRGLLFAPVYWRQPVYANSRFSFCPNVVVDVGALHFHLFARPRYSHYYFGDYYSNSYLSFGIFPWFQFHSRHHGYDPLYVHHYWRRSRADRDWSSRLRRDYAARAVGTGHRQPRNFRAHESAGRGRVDANNRQVRAVFAASQLNQHRDLAFRVGHVDGVQRAAQRDRVQGVRRLAEQRLQLESRGNADRTPRRNAARSVTAGTRSATGPTTLTLPRSPIVGRSSTVIRRTDRGDRSRSPGGRGSAVAPDFGNRHGRATYSRGSGTLQAQRSFSSGNSTRSRSSFGAPSGRIPSRSGSPGFLRGGASRSPGGSRSFSRSSGGSGSPRASQRSTPSGGSRGSFGGRSRGRGGRD